MTHPIALSPDFHDLSRLQKSALSLRKGREQAFLIRMARLDAKRNELQVASTIAEPATPDVALLAERKAFEDAWAVEIEAMIRMKRIRTAEATAIADAARAATARVVRRIELAQAATFEGFKLKARAALWRRDGEPLPPAKRQSVRRANTGWKTTTAYDA